MKIEKAIYQAQPSSQIDKKDRLCNCVRRQNEF